MWVRGWERRHPENKKNYRHFFLISIFLNFHPDFTFVGGKNASSGVQPTQMRRPLVKMFFTPPQSPLKKMQAKKLGLFRSCSWVCIRIRAVVCHYFFIVQCPSHIPIREHHHATTVPHDVPSAPLLVGQDLVALREATIYESDHGASPDHLRSALLQGPVFGFGEPLPILSGSALDAQALLVL